MIDLTPIILAVITIIGALITYKLIPWIKTQTTADQYELLLTTVRILVYSAEQMKLKGLIEDKYSYVQEQLILKGFTVDLDAIQAMVREMVANGDDAPKIEAEV